MSIFFKSGPNKGLVRSREVRDAVVALARAKLGKAEGPDQPGHLLGKITTPDGPFRVVARHAVDLVMLDEERRRVVLIKRIHPPGAGAWALPGGFIDAGETTAEAAVREAEEETGIIASLRKLVGAAGRKRSRRNLVDAIRPLPPWRIARRFDIRGTSWLKQSVPLAKSVTLRPGDLLAVTTQPFVLVLPEIADMTLRAGDDASAVRIAEVAKLDKSDTAVGDHLDIIRQAVAAARA